MQNIPLVKSLYFWCARARRATIVLSCQLLLCLVPATLWAGEGSALIVPRGPEIIAHARKDVSRPFGPALTATRYASVNPDALREIRGSSGKVIFVGNSPIVGNKFDIVLPGDGRVTLVVDSITELFPGVVTVAGYLESDHGAEFAFSVDEDSLLGSLSMGRYRWVVEPDNAAEGLHTIRKIDKTRIPRIPDEDIEDSDEPSLTARSSPTCSGTVRILFLYANNVSGAGQRASNIVATMNQALRNSLVSFNNRITSAGLKLVPDSFAGQSRATILNRMTNRQAPFAALREDDMFFASADVAFLLVQEDANANDIPGFGRVGGAAKNLEHANPYALSTDDYALGDLTALHELGHVFGGKHEDYPSGIRRPQIQADGDWMTLMGGYIDSRCPFVGLPATGTCERIPYFSNPAVTYLGEPTGTVGAADMESYLEGTMPTVACWHETGDPLAPSPPDPIQSISEQCYGIHSVSWTAQAGATDYELYRSTSSSFTNPVLIYNGTGTSTVINVPSGTWYLRARACNGSGCSNYTAQVSATRIGGCF